MGSMHFCSYLRLHFKQRDGALRAGSAVAVRGVHVHAGFQPRQQLVAQAEFRRAGGKLQQVAVRNHQQPDFRSL